jgi:hypothetical protein
MMAEDYATDLRNSDKSVNIVFSCSKEHLDKRDHRLGYKV